MENGGAVFAGVRGEFGWIHLVNAGSPLVGGPFSRRTHDRARRRRHLLNDKGGCLFFWGGGSSAARERSQFFVEIGSGAKNEGVANLVGGEQAALHQPEKIGARRLMNDVVAPAVAFDGIAGVGLAERMREQCLLTVVDSVDSVQAMLG